MRIGVAQLNATVGDLDGNLALAIDAYEQLVGQGVDLVAYPELISLWLPSARLVAENAFRERSGRTPERLCRTNRVPRRQ